MPPIHWDTIITGLVSAALMWGVHRLTDVLKRYHADSAAWRERVDVKLDAQAAKVDTLMDATQTTMRAQLIHNAEKYFERDWITPEERASWCDMHDRYSALGADGLIETYRRKIDNLPDREI